MYNITLVNESYYSSVTDVRSPILISSGTQFMCVFGPCMYFTSICISPRGHIDLVSTTELSK